MADPATTLAERLAGVPDNDSWAARPGGVRKAAVAMILRFGPEAGPDVLLTTRAEHEGDRWSGQVSLPGGHADERDKDLLATAIRETREEVGLDLTRNARPLGALAPLQARARGELVPLFITPFVFVQERAAELVLNHEVADAFRLPLASAAAGELDTEHRVEHRGVIERLPSWHFEERVVWGLTLGMLAELLRVSGGLFLAPWDDS